jgi:hypothetical protein
MRTLILTAALLAVAAPVAAGDTNVELRLSLPELVAGPNARGAAFDPMEQLLWAVNMEQALLLRGGQPGSAAAPVFLIRVAGGQPPEVIAAALDNGVRIRENVVVEIPWPWQPRADQEDDLDAAVAAELGRRLNSRFAESAGK